MSAASRAVPVTSRTEWERQYRSGRWDYLAESEEDARYEAIVQRILASGSCDVLDIGCGSGVLRDRLGDRFTGRFVGVDWSHAALAARTPWPGESLVCGDASRLPLRHRFDTVVLSEVLYYLDQPGRAVARTLDLVAPGGELLVSLFQPSRRRHPGWHTLIGEIGAELGDAQRLVTTGGGRSWALHVLTPGGGS
ncbi:methyltransferase family protein [Streptomyces sp. TLI_235]|nr:class I SAM-dependent methyltransferase [Streptomyces sp. TLI_235]PBC66226.1 methyltransferase family protein [Streptomyces sp. TLI_235]